MTTSYYGVSERADRVAAHLLAWLGGRLDDLESTTPDRLYATIVPDLTVHAARALFDGLEARYVITVGLDRRGEGQGFEVLHCFALDREHLRCALRIPLDHERPVLPSITEVVPGAAWAEAEIHDLFGIEVSGHPDPRRLILPDGFPEGVHPLRKDFPYDAKVVFDGPARPMKEPPPGTTVMRLGPFFPVLEEPSQWRLFVDGERVVGADYRGFYSHRAVEKLAEAKLSYNQVINLAERICGICGCVHSTAYCQAVEEATGLMVPRRARLIRTFILELERLQSHLLWLGIACHMVGFDFVFQQSWRVREPVMELAEYLTGSRKHFQVNLVGGVTFDITRAKAERILRTLDRVEADAAALAKALEGDDALVSRLRGVGLFTPAEVRQWGAVGPTARGSGVAVDTRKDHPYAAYDELDFSVVTHDGCDNWGRTVVRLGETFESLKLLRQCVRRLGDMPEGGLMADVPDALPPLREGMHAVEAPRGEVFHYVRTGHAEGPDRWRVRAPSYQNIQSVPVMLKAGTTVADVPITLGSVDPCFSCTERMEVVDVGAGTRRLLRKAAIRELARTGVLPSAGGEGRA